MKRLLQVTILFAVLACFAAGSASALTFQDRTCDNSKPTCMIPAGNAEVPYQFDMYARSGCPPYHYNITGGTPPPGLTLSTVNDAASGGIGRLNGTPTTPGTTRSGSRSRRRSRRPASAIAPTGYSRSRLGPRRWRSRRRRSGAASSGAAYTETLTASGEAARRGPPRACPPASPSAAARSPARRPRPATTRSPSRSTTAPRPSPRSSRCRSSSRSRSPGPPLVPAEVGQAVHGRLPGDRWARHLHLGGHRRSRGPDLRSQHARPERHSDCRRALHREGDGHRRRSRPDTGSAPEAERRRACRHHDDQAQGGDRRQDVRCSSSRRRAASSR